MYTRTLFPGSILLLTLMLIGSKPICGDTIAAEYQFTGSAKNLVIANGFITSDGVASGSVNGLSEVAFDTHNKVNVSTLQNYGTFTMIFPNGDTAFGNLHEDDTKVSLKTFSGPFTQTLNFSGGTGEFEDVSGRLTGGGFIHPTYYTTSGTGTLTGPGLVASPEPGSGVFIVMGLSIACFGVLRRLSSDKTHLRNG